MPWTHGHPHRVGEGIGMALDVSSAEQESQAPDLAQINDRLAEDAAKFDQLKVHL